MDFLKKNWVLVAIVLFLVFGGNIKVSENSQEVGVAEATPTSSIHERFLEYTPEAGRAGDGATLIAPYDRILKGDVDVILDDFHSINASVFTDVRVTLIVRKGGAYPMCIHLGWPKTGDDPSLRSLDRIQRGMVKSSPEFAYCELAWRIGDLQAGIVSNVAPQYLQIIPGQPTNESTPGFDESGNPTNDHRESVTIYFRPPFGTLGAGQEVGNSGVEGFWEPSGTIMDLRDGGQKLTKILGLVGPETSALQVDNIARTYANIGAEIDLWMPIDIVTGGVSYERLNQLQTDLVASVQPGTPAYNNIRQELCVIADGAGFDAVDVTSDGDGHVTITVKDSCSVVIEPQWPDPNRQGTWFKLISIGVMPDSNSPNYQAEMATYLANLEETVPLDMLEGVHHNNTWLYAKHEVIPNLGLMYGPPDFALQRLDE